MKKHVSYIAILATVTTAVLAHAQTEETAAAVESSTVQVTEIAAPTATVAPTPTPAPTLAPAPTATATVITTPVETLAPVVEKQPVTVIEASPLSVSRAEQLRKAREASEVQTEQKIVESLEESRIQAEQKRQQEILNSMKSEPVVAAPAAPVAPVVVAPVVAPPPALSADEVRGVIRAELDASKATEKPKSYNYVSGSVGMLDYDAVDIETIGAAGVAFGKVFEERWAVELGVGGARAYVNENAWIYRELEQFSVGLASKLYILTGRVRPTVGFGVNYTHRNYSDYRDTGWYQLPYGEMQSWALDYGWSAGLEFAASENFSMGMEFRYSANLTYEYDNEFYNTASYRSAYGDWTPLEERDSQYWGFNVKYMF